MYDGYINTVKSVVKNKPIVLIDRFHIAKQYRGELDQYRKKILKQLKNELSDYGYNKLKGAMHILRRSNEYLTKDEDEKEILNNLFSHSPELAQAYKLAIKPTQILNTHMTRDQALIKINAWIKEVKQSQLTCFNQFIRTLKKYKQQVGKLFILAIVSSWAPAKNAGLEGVIGIISFKMIKGQRGLFGNGWFDGYFPYQKYPLGLIAGSGLAAGRWRRKTAKRMGAADERGGWWPFVHEWSAKLPAWL